MARTMGLWRQLITSYQATRWPWALLRPSVVRCGQEANDSGSHLLDSLTWKTASRLPGLPPRAVRGVGAAETRLQVAPGVRQQVRRRSGPAFRPKFGKGSSPGSVVVCADPNSGSIFFVLTSISFR